MKLSLASALKTKTPPAGRYSDGRNLYLNVTKTGAKTWVYCWLPKKGHAADKGYQREFSLGSATGAGATIWLTLEDARLAADRVRIQIADGIDPIKARSQGKVDAEISALTFEQLMLDTIEIEKADWKEGAGNEEQWLSSLRKHCPKIAGRPADEKNDAIPSMRAALVNDDVVIAALKPIWKEIPETAERVRFRMEKIMKLAMKRGAYKGTENPARYEGHVEYLGKRPTKAKRGERTKNSHLAIAYADMPAFVPKLTKKASHAAKALWFAILTAARTDEARLARWIEIDLDAAEWTIPAERMKAGVKHIVPLSQQAVDLLRSMPRDVGSDIIFWGKGGKELGATALADVLCKPSAKGGLGYAGKATVHGMRSSFRDWVGDKLRGYSDSVFEFCLAHGLPATEASYRRATALEQRAEIMQAWADYCEGKSNVVALRAAA